MSTSSETAISQITDSKKQLDEALKQLSPDEFLISGLLNYIRSRFLTLILKDVNTSLKKQTSEDELQLAQKTIPAEQTTEHLIDRIWGEFHHPVFKYYQAQLKALKKEESKHRKRTVEMRKMFEKFSKIAAAGKSFYNDLIKHVLCQHQLKFIVPEYIYETLGLTESPNAIKVDKTDNVVIVKLVYLAHRSLLFLGAASRYQSSLSQYLTPNEQQNYDRALDLCHSSELILPAFGETRNQIGMIYDAQNDKLSSLYEFLRSSLARIPSKVGVANFKSIINNVEENIEKLNKARLESKITKENQSSILSASFIGLYGYYTNPDGWKRENGTLINGTKVSAIENDFFTTVKNIANAGNDEFVLEKLLCLLIGSISLVEISESNTVTPLGTSLLKFIFKFINYIQTLFIELWDNDKAKSQELLPTLRIVYSWLKVNKLALQYSHRNFEFLKSTSLISNIIYSTYPDDFFENRPKRDQYFSEDVGLREFTPINRLLSDFDDASLFSDSNGPTKLIGKFKDHNPEEEIYLRMIAVGTITKNILRSNSFGIVFDKESKLFDLTNAKAPQKKLRAKSPKKTVTEEALISQPKSSIQSSSSQKPLENNNKHKNRRQRRKKKNLKVEDSDEEVNSSKSSDVVQITKEAYEATYDSSYIKETDNVLKIDKAINAEDLEAKLTSKDENYQNMVDSLVDDVYSSQPKQNPTITNSNNWHSQFPSNQQNGGPFLNQDAKFPYQFYGTGNNQQMYQQYQSFFQNQPQIQHQPQPQPQQLFTPSNQFQYGQYQNSYNQFSPIVQVPSTLSQLGNHQSQLSQQQSQNNANTPKNNHYYQYQ